MFLDFGEDSSKSLWLHWYLDGLGLSSASVTTGPVS